MAQFTVRELVKEVLDITAKDFVVVCISTRRCAGGVMTRREAETFARNLPDHEVCALVRL